MDLQEHKSVGETAVVRDVTWNRRWQAADPAPERQSCARHRRSAEIRDRQSPGLVGDSIPRHGCPERCFLPAAGRAELCLRLQQVKSSQGGRLGTRCLLRSCGLLHCLNTSHHPAGTTGHLLWNFFKISEPFRVLLK